MQSYSQCDLILVVTWLQVEGWIPEVPSPTYLIVPQTALLEESLVFEAPFHTENKNSQS